MALLPCSIVAIVVAALGPAAMAPPSPVPPVDEDQIKTLLDENCEELGEELDRPSLQWSIDSSVDEAAPRRAPRPLDPALTEEALAVAEAIDPALAKRLAALRDRDRAAFDQAMRSGGRRLIGLAQLKARDPQLYGMKLAELRLDEQVNRTASRLRDALDRPGDDLELIARLQEELRQKVILQTALSIGARANYLDRLQKHVKALEESINRDASNFNQTVQQRIDQLLNEDPSVPVSASPALTQRD